MNIPTLLIAVVHDDDHGCCDAKCPDLDAGIPTVCLRFDAGHCCKGLDRNAEGRIRRCDECEDAESAYLRALGGNP